MGITVRKRCRQNRHCPCNCWGRVCTNRSRISEEIWCSGVGDCELCCHDFAFHVFSLFFALLLFTWPWRKKAKHHRGHSDSDDASRDGSWSIQCVLCHYEGIERLYLLCGDCCWWKLDFCRHAAHWSWSLVC